MNKKIYINEFEGISLYDDKIGLSAKIVFKDAQTFEEIQNMRKSQYLILCDEEPNKNLIKYLEDKINMCDGYIDTTRSDLEEVKYTLFAYDNLKKSIEKNIKARNIYQDLLERIKNNNYE